MEDNLFNWYKFNKNSSVLEIEPYSFKTTEFLSKQLFKSLTVVSNLEEIYNIDNVTIVYNEVNELIDKEKFDYIILYNPLYLKIAKDLVNVNGTILLATDNRFGISFWAGASHNGRIYNTLENEKEDLLSKKELVNLLKELKLDNYKFYYPLPNYKRTNVIFSDKYLPKTNDTKISYNIVYENNSIILFDELKVLKQLIKNDLFTIFTNSFLIEINMNNNFDNAKFISFNNNRKEQYRLATIIYDEIVEKKMMSNLSENHIKNIEKNINNLKNLNFNIIDNVKDNIIYSEFITQDTFDKILVYELQNGNKNKFFDLISKWYSYLKERLVLDENLVLNSCIQFNEQEIINLTIIKNGYIDLTFENTFYNSNDFKFFDQEWYLENIPLEFILYRAINNLYVYNGDLNKILKLEEVIDFFDLNKYIELFKKIESYFQSNILDDNQLYLNQKSIEKLRDINEIGVLSQQIIDFKENDKLQSQCIKNLENDNKKKQEYIEDLENDNKNKQEYIDNLENLIKDKDNQLSVLEDQIKNKSLLKRLFDKGEE